MKILSYRSASILIIIGISLLTGCNESAYRQFELSMNTDNSIEVSFDDRAFMFKPEFTVLYSDTDPSLKLRPAGIKGVRYNIPTWKNTTSGDSLQEVERDVAQQGDGFDDRILDGESFKRTPNLFHAGKIYKITAESYVENRDSIVFEFPKNDQFDLAATLTLSNGYPELKFNFQPKEDGYYSVGYSGAPAQDISETSEIWQPLIWQEKRFPPAPYMTLAFRCPIPTAFVKQGDYVTGVLAHPDEFPFDPLPLAENSRFGVAVRNLEGKAQPLLFAPVLGGSESKMSTGQRFSFSMFLFLDKGDCNDAYEAVARQFFGFKDYRKNGLITLNQTLDNIVEYSLSKYSRFNAEQKGFEYSTDVPGAVKNVSSLNPLELALVYDDEKMYEQRAYPLIEYMLSREKFLFCLDTTQKIQYPSRKMDGPIAPVTELVSLYNIFGESNPFLVDLAKEEYEGERIRNLDVIEKGKNWKNSLSLYRATGEEKYLQAAKNGADVYLRQRVETPQTDFSDPTSGGAFFWTGFTSKWIDLLRLYEITEEDKYLKAAQEGARQYTMFMWMSPKIPDTTITVNEGGKAPLYWYLERKGHAQMYFPEEEVPAWRLSEIGLTPESSSTSSGHRAIFMANYAPWMLRLGYYTDDAYLREAAKAAIIGRYQNFPGYHINTARTTAYEKADYPLREHKELSVNSFHYNHIMPMASMLLDYLVTDAFVKSDGQINFPSEFIEGYAYLQNKFYGQKAGKFYEDDDVYLWMPAGLLKTSNVELNYIAARNDENLYIAFTNQSGNQVDSEIRLNQDLAPIEPEETYIVRIWRENKPVANGELKDGKISLKANADGITAICIEGLKVLPEFQNNVLDPKEKVIWSKDYVEEQDFGMRAMLLNMGTNLKTAYIFLQADNSKFNKVSISYTNPDGKLESMTDNAYPFEFTLPLMAHQDEFDFQLSGVKVDGSEIVSGKLKLSK